MKNLKRPQVDSELLEQAKAAIGIPRLSDQIIIEIALEKLKKDPTIE